MKENTHIYLFCFIWQEFGVTSIVYVTVKTERKLSGVDDSPCMALEKKEKPK